MTMHHTDTRLWHRYTRWNGNWRDWGNNARPSHSTSSTWHYYWLVVVLVIVVLHDARYTNCLHFCLHFHRFVSLWSYLFPAVTEAAFFKARMFCTFLPSETNAREDGDVKQKVLKIVAFSCKLSTSLMWTCVCGYSQ